MKSFKQYIRETSSEPQDTAPQELLVMDVRHFLDAVATNYEDDCTAEVTLNSPEPDSISVKFFPQTDETDHHGSLLSTFELSVVKVGDELPDLRDYAIVKVTLDKHDPTKVQLRFRKDEESGD